MTLNDTISKITRADDEARKLSKQRWDAVAKPLESLGLLEDAIIKIAAMQRSPDVDISKRAVVVMCADNGVVAEGVTQTDQEVTAIVTENMNLGVTSVCRMSRTARADVIPVDIGVYREVRGERILQRNIRRGTRNMAVEPAMTPDETIAAIETGIDIACMLYDKGYRLLATGEMGIGNTSSSSAVASVLLDCDPEIVTGRGAGLSSDGLVRKVNAIRKAISVNKPDPSDALDTLSKVGGLDIAGLTGVFIGGALCHIPVLIDGFISSVSALTAVRLCPAVADYILASHVSNEPAGAMTLNALDVAPLIYAKMCLGEGTGAVAAIPLLDMALSLYSDMTTFEDISIEAYIPQS